jgi:orotate phosphoribosyltransferase
LFCGKISRLSAIRSDRRGSDGGIPHGALLADRLDLPFVYVRAQAKSHGRQNLIEGELKSGQRALVIEDLISTGGSCLQAVEALRNAGCAPAGVLAIFTYGFDRAEQAFGAAAVPFDTLSHYDALIEAAVGAQYLAASDLTTLRQWRVDPQSWSNGFAE